MTESVILQLILIRVHSNKFSKLQLYSIFSIRIVQKLIFDLYCYYETYTLSTHTFVASISNSEPSSWNEILLYILLADSRLCSIAALSNIVDPVTWKLDNDNDFRSRWIYCISYPIMLEFQRVQRCIQSQFKPSHLDLLGQNCERSKEPRVAK